MRQTLRVMSLANINQSNQERLQSGSKRQSETLKESQGVETSIPFGSHKIAGRGLCLNSSSKILQHSSITGLPLYPQTTESR